MDETFMQGETSPEQEPQAGPEEEAAFEEGFFDEGAETQVPGEEDAAGEPTAEAADESDEPRYTVKYNGQELEMPVSELIVNAQKGMNYDHVRGELESLRHAREFSVLDRYAAQSGMGREQYLDLLDQQVNTPQAQFHYERHRQFVELAREYPDIKEFPREVIEAISRGEAPLAAYRAWDLQQARHKLAVLEQNRQARRRAAGSAQSELGTEDYDGFLEGFGSV